MCVCERVHSLFIWLRDLKSYNKSRLCLCIQMLKARSISSVIDFSVLNPSSCFCCLVCARIKCEYARHASNTVLLSCDFYSKKLANNKLISLHFSKEK